MKKKITVFMLAIMMVATAIFTIASCSKSDSKNNNAGNNANIVGKWRGTTDDSVITLDIKSNGTGVAQIKYEDYYYGTSTYTVNFTYSIDDDGTLGTAIAAVSSYYYSTEYETYSFALNGPNLYIYEESAYYGSQIICMFTKI